MRDRTHDGRAFRILTIIDEYTRECLDIVVRRRVTSPDVIATSAELFMRKGVPEFIRSDNRPELRAEAVQDWLSRLDVTVLLIEAGSPWENDYCESFNRKLRDELLSREVFYTLEEAKVLIESRRVECSETRPHSGPGNRAPAVYVADLPGIGAGTGFQEERFPTP